jgi:hypothetical protein
VYVFSEDEWRVESGESLDKTRQDKTRRNNYRGINEREG